MIDHLLRRAGFGARADELALYEPLSYSDAVDRLVDYPSIPDTVDSHIGQPGYVGTTSQGPFSPDTVINDARQRWLFRMVHADRPLQEKMTLAAPISRPRPAEESHAPPPGMPAAAARRFRSPHTPFPQAHVLSNGNFMSVVTNAGRCPCATAVAA